MSQTDHCARSKVEQIPMTGVSGDGAMPQG